MGDRTSRRVFSATAVGAIAAAGLISKVSAQSKTDSTWEQIKKTGKVRMGVFDYPPYYIRDRASGKWTGALVEMGEDIAKELDVKYETVEVGGWGEVVLAIQSNKIDFHPGLQATPKRATAIDFAGPIYWISWVAVNNKNFKGKTWEDYNKPEVKVAVMSGSADDQVLRLMAPKATRVEMKELSQIILAVTSGRADAFTTTVLSSMIAKSKNPDLGEFVTPTPIASLPGYIGLRMEDDSRFQKFVDRWAEYNILLGYNEQRLMKYMNSVGVTEIPPTVSFRK